MRLSAAYADEADRNPIIRLELKHCHLSVFCYAKLRRRSFEPAIFK